MTRFTIGADPELFMHDGNGKIIPACGQVGGTKDKPLPLKKGAMQEDNVLVEFNIDPAHSEDEFIDNLRTVIGQLPVPVATNCTHVFKLDLLKQFGQQAMEFGCDPDYNAYTLTQNTPPNPEAVGGLRTAGGHIHIGGLSGLQIPLSVIVMDMLMGNTLRDRVRGEKERAQMYGGAGSYREKPYGAEYRAVGNFWLKDERLARWAYQCAVAAADFVSSRTVNWALHDLLLEVGGGLRTDLADCMEEDFDLDSDTPCDDAESAIDELRNTTIQPKWAPTIPDVDYNQLEGDAFALMKEA